MMMYNDGCKIHPFEWSLIRKIINLHIFIKIRLYDQKEETCPPQPLNHIKHHLNSKYSIKYVKVFLESK